MSARMAREIKLLTTEPPPGVCAWPINDRLDELSAQIQVQTDQMHLMHLSSHNFNCCTSAVITMHQQWDVLPAGAKGYCL